MVKRRADGQPAGKTSSYAFFVKKCREEHRHSNPNDKIDFKDFSVKCADKWRKMPDHQKKPFSNLAKKDADRHSREMDVWKKANPQAAAASGKNKKEKKDPNQPKRALSAFFFFCGEKRTQVKAENPSFSVGEIAKRLGEYWRNMSEEDQKVYQEMHNKDKSRYDKEMAEYKRGGGGSPSKKAKKGPPPKEVSEEEDEEEESEEEESEDEESD